MNVNSKGQPTKKLRILIIEDDPYDLKMIIWMISKITAFSIEYHTAKTLEEVRQVFSNNEIDMLLCDYWLKGQTSFDLLNQFDRDLKDMPFVVMTSLENHTVRNQSLDKGAVAFLGKADLTPKSLENAIATAAHKSRGGLHSTKENTFDPDDQYEFLQDIVSRISVVEQYSGVHLTAAQIKDALSEIGSDIRYQMTSLSGQINSIEEKARTFDLREVLAFTLSQNEVLSDDDLSRIRMLPSDLPIQISSYLPRVLKAFEEVVILISEFGSPVPQTEIRFGFQQGDAVVELLFSDGVERLSSQDVFVLVSKETQVRCDSIDRLLSALGGFSEFESSGKSAHLTVCLPKEFKGPIDQGV
jgi:CheY-like chemotaxis protein